MAANWNMVVSYPAPERLVVGVYEMNVVDATGQEISRKWITVVRRESGQVPMLASPWIRSCTWSRVEGTESGDRARRGGRWAPTFGSTTLPTICYI